MSRDVRELTPPGSGGVAVLSVRGGDALARLARLAGGRLPAVGEVRFVRLVADRTGPLEELLDEGLLVARSDGSVEVHVHGGRAVVSAVVGELLASGPAAAGFAPSAVLAERLRALAARAPTVLGARLVLAQVEGERLARAVAGVLALEGDARRALVQGLVASARAYTPLLSPARIALRGPVNAGKSTLLNVLAGIEVALVSDVPGTTRDAVAAEVELGGWPFVVVDTAGDRDVDGDPDTSESARAIERAGQTLASEVSARADLVLLVERAGGATDASLAPGSARIFTRAAEAFGDDPSAWPADHVSALEHPEHAVQRLGEVVLRALERPPLWPLDKRLARGDAPCVPVDPPLLAALERVSQSFAAHIPDSEGDPPLDALARLL